MMKYLKYNDWRRANFILDIFILNFNKIEMFNIKIIKTTKPLQLTRFINSETQNVKFCLQLVQKINVCIHI